MSPCAGVRPFSPPPPPPQRVNHFKNHYELTRKDNLVKNIKRMKKQLERADAMEEAAKYSFLPTSFVLPMEYGEGIPHTTVCAGAVLCARGPPRACCPLPA